MAAGRLRKNPRHRRRRRKRRRKAILFDEIMPQTKTVKLRYVEEIQLNPGLLAVAFSNFACNGLFDPNVSGGGHQPMLFDQIMPLYDHYRVLSSHIRMTAVPEDPLGSGVTPGYFGVMLNDNVALLYATPTAIIESGQGKGAWDVYGPYDRIPTVTKSFNSSKIFGKSRALGDDQLLGNDATNPSEQYLYTVWAGTIGANDPATFNFLLEIEYVAQFTEPKEVAQS